MRFFLGFFLLFISNYSFCGDTTSHKLNRKSAILLDAGYSFNYSKIISTQFTSPVGFELKPFPSFAFSIGYVRSKGSYFGGIKIKHLSIGDKQSIDASFGNGDPTNIYVSSSKPNFFIGVFGGISFRLAKINLAPYLGCEYSLTPDLNSAVEGFYSVQDDTLFVLKQTKYISSKILLLNGGFNISIPVKVGKIKFDIAYNLSYSMGFENVYFSNTRFYSKSKEYIFNNNNKGSHLINSIQFYIPLSGN